MTDIDPQRTALLLMDLQPAIVGLLDEPDALLEERLPPAVSDEDLRPWRR